MNKDKVLKLVSELRKIHDDLRDAALVDNVGVIDKDFHCGADTIHIEAELDIDASVRNTINEKLCDLGYTIEDLETEISQDECE